MYRCGFLYEGIWKLKRDTKLTISKVRSGVLFHCKLRKAGQGPGKEAVAQLEINILALA